MVPETAIYATLKLIHISCAAASVSGFALRGVWMLVDSPLAKTRWALVVPHVIDTVFLLSGIALIFQIQQYPFVHGWLTVKLAGLIVYIVLGTIALKRGATKRIRAIALVFALLGFGFLVSVALSHRMLGIFAGLDI